jgi:hypothetical protein
MDPSASAVLPDGHIAMKAEEIIERLFDNKRGITLDRIKKAQGLAQRSKLDWDAIVEKMTPEQRQALQAP